ncbi:hypothetical protein BDN67DRAFT_434197 [Paxillus ammoniavirescens]|nr:hypothetical protein BDN67DRAFT_434197 [Paxillus ammoniavirescens]
MDTVTTERYLRVASLSIASYDYIITLPAEWRLYRSQYRDRDLGLSHVCILFVLIRYVSIIVMVVSNYGMFSPSFTEESCQRYFIAAPIFKGLSKPNVPQCSYLTNSSVLQTMVSHAILGFRTFNIMHKSRRLGVVLVISFVVVTGVRFFLQFISAPTDGTFGQLEWFINMYNRVPVLFEGECTPGNSGSSAWTYYLVVMVYDLGTLIVSTIYLVRRHNMNGRFSRLIKTLLYDGLGYFAALTAVNIFNVIFYRESDEIVQPSGASFGYAVTWIMSQRILTHLRELNSKSEGFDNVVTRQFRPGRDAATAIRSLQKGPVVVDIGPDSPAAKSTDEMELDIRVDIEQSMAVHFSRDRGKLRGQW